MRFYPYTLRYGEDNAKRLSVPPRSRAPSDSLARHLVGADLNALVNSDAIASLSPALIPSSSRKE
jgi:hypothetical protein